MGTYLVFGLLEGCLFSFWTLRVATYLVFGLLGWELIKFMDF